jgi:hypothetical protein
VQGKKFEISRLMSCLFGMTDERSRVVLASNETSS